MSEAPRRVGILGGSFDPVHLGHLIAAQDAFEQVQLDRVVFMPAVHAPLKDRPASLGIDERLRLLEAAVAGDSRFEVSRLELERGGTSYSVDTARAWRERHPRDRLFWIIGSDQAGQLDRWHEIEELGRLLEFIVLARPGQAAAPAQLPPGVRIHAVSAHQFDVSSSEIRERLLAGKPVRYFLPSAVAEMIETRQMYR